MKRRSIWSFCILLGLADCLLAILFLIGSDPRLMVLAQQQGLKTVVLQQSRAPILDRNFHSFTDETKEVWGFVFPSGSDLTEEELLRVKDQTILDMDTPCVVPLTRAVYSDHIFSFEKTVRAGASSLAVHLLGYVDGDNNGVAGLEYAYNDYLLEQGNSTQVTYYVDGTGEIYENTIPVLETQERSGALVLTLDKDLQAIAETAAETYIDRGAIVVLDVESGDILASCSTPSFSPDDVESSLEDPEEPFNNRAFLSYNVGSVFKPVLAAAALEEGLEDFTYTCTGSIEVDGVTFRCNKIAGHGTLDMEEAICQSCNPYFIALGQQLGYEKVYSMAAALGFGSGTSFGEGVYAASGSLPDPKQIESPADAANIFFGQGRLTATPLQLARMMAAIAGDGTVPPVNLIEGLAEGTDIVDDTMTYKGTVRAFSAETAQRLREMLKTVVDRGSGTAANPVSGGAAGKTGSAQTGQYNADGTEIVQGWFVGFYPYDNPKYVISVVAENSLYGSTAAAPAFQYICNRIYVEKGI